MSLPTADDLFRPTALPEEAAPGEAAEQPEETDSASSPAAEPEGAAEEPAARRRTASGRVRHDEKMTVYITAEELLELEHARLALRRQTGRAVDRGRLVRAAVAIALADLDEKGEDSQLVQRLKQT